MKNRKILFLIIALVLIALIASIVLLNKKEEKNADIDDENTTYVVRVGLVDDKSPDRTLTVLRNDKKIEFVEIHYMDDVLLCKGTNPTVHFGDIKDEKELKVILKNKKVVIAKIEEGDIE